MCDHRVAMLYIVELMTRHVALRQRPKHWIPKDLNQVGLKDFSRYTGYIHDWRLWCDSFRQKIPADWPNRLSHLPELPDRPRTTLFTEPNDRGWSDYSTSVQEVEPIKTRSMRRGPLETQSKPASPKLAALYKSEVPEPPVAKVARVPPTIPTQSTRILRPEAASIKKPIRQGRNSTNSMAENIRHPAPRVDPKSKRKAAKKAYMYMNKENEASLPEQKQEWCTVQ